MVIQNQNHETQAKHLPLKIVGLFKCFAKFLCLIIRNRLFPKVTNYEYILRFYTEYIPYYFRVRICCCVNTLLGLERAGGKIDLQAGDHKM